MQNEEGLLLAPAQYRLYLILHHSLNLIHGIQFCLFYLDNLINGKLPFTLAWFSCSYLFLTFIFSLLASILYVLIIPQLITINNKRKRDFIISMKLFLEYNLNSYMSKTQDFIDLLYFLGFLLFLQNSCTSLNEEINTIIFLINYSFFMNLIRLSIIACLYRNLKESIKEEQYKKFIKIYQLNQHSEIIKQLCPICHDFFKFKDFIAEYMCIGKHKFHKECIIKWLDIPSNKQKTCPYCRQQAQTQNQLFL